MPLRRALALAVVVAGCGAADPAVDAAPPVDGAMADVADLDAAVDAAVDAPSICDHEPRADTYAPGLVRTGAGGFQVELRSVTPAPPPRGNSAWALRIVDAAAAPRGDLVLAVVPFMPDHGHGTSVVPVITPGADGGYLVDPVNLWMRGLWQVRIGIAAAAAPGVELDAVTFAFCVR